MIPARTADDGEYVTFRRAMSDEIEATVSVIRESGQTGFTILLLFPLIAGAIGVAGLLWMAGI